MGFVVGPEGAAARESGSRDVRQDKATQRWGNLLS
jgi:hypothetical protein